MLKIVWNIVGYSKNPFHFVFELEEVMNGHEALPVALTPQELCDLCYAQAQCSIGVLMQHTSIKQSKLRQ